MHTYSYTSRCVQTPASLCLPHMSLCGSKVGMKRHKDAMRDLETYRLLLYPPLPALPCTLTGPVCPQDAYAVYL